MEFVRLSDLVNRLSEIQESSEKEGKKKKEKEREGKKKSERERKGKRERERRKEKKKERNRAKKGNLFSLPFSGRIQNWDIAAAG